MNGAAETTNHYIKKDWPLTKNLQVGVKNVEREGKPCGYQKGLTSTTLH